MSSGINRRPPGAPSPVDPLKMIEQVRNGELTVEQLAAARTQVAALAETSGAPRLVTPFETHSEKVADERPHLDPEAERAWRTSKSEQLGHLRAALGPAEHADSHQAARDAREAQARAQDAVHFGANAKPVF